MDRPTISLALIVKNVEKTIEKCLDSFSQCVDEIVIVDTGSTDRTLEILPKYTDKIYHFEWIDDFSAARNYNFSLCTGDFLFWNDGDDFIDVDNIRKIKEFDFSDKEIVICNYIYARDEFGQPLSIVPRERIIKRSLGLQWCEPIHEYLPLRGAKVFVSDITTIHNKQHGTSERNVKILEKIVNKEPVNPRNLYYLGKEYLEFGRYDEAIVYLEKFIAHKDLFWEDCFQAYYKLALCYLYKNDGAGFKRNLFESIKIEDGWAEPFYQLGLFYMNQLQYQKAIHWFEYCTKLKRTPGLLSPYQPEYYTWLPYLNLCVCYDKIGEVEKAYDCNKKVLEYRQDKRAISNEELLARVLREKKAAKITKKNGEDKRLHLGCGGKRIDGYINVDIFKAPGVDEIFSMDAIPYQDGTIGGILSEHSLEHLTFEAAELALKEWYRVLKPGGELLLYMPDFENCCKSYLNAPLEDPYFRKTRAWFKQTVYGVQKSQGGEPDEAQIHKCGFSKEEIRIVVNRNGFVVDTVENYGGPGQKPDYGTPSMAIRALKPISDIQLCWVCSENWEAAQTRIRVLRVNQWLQSQGYKSVVTDFETAKNYNIIIVGKEFSERALSHIREFKRLGKTVYCDICESILDFPFVSDILRLCDRVICCSETLAEQVRVVNSNIVVIEDAFEI